MSPAAGETIIAGRVPGERVATSIETADSSTFTTAETQVMSVTAPLVSGRTYRVRFHGGWGSSAANDRLIARIREDSTSGTELQGTNVIVGAVSGAAFMHALEAEYTAVATADKTFIVSGVRSSGTGNCRLEAAASHPAYLCVDYIRG